MRVNNLKYIHIKSKTKYLVFIFLYFSLFFLAKILYGRKNNWLICERGIDAQDNGFCFFKYLRKKHRDINAFFLIKKKSSDYQKVSAIGKTVEFGSFKHFLMVIGCPVKISSHLFGYCPWRTFTLYLRRNRTLDLHIFLQHGVIKNTHEGFFGNVCKSLDMFVCGAKKEYDFILNTFVYDKNVPQYTGLARYDYLIDCKLKNQILIMPTWRRELSNLSIFEFEKSTYFNQWNSLLNNARLNDACKKANLKTKFYLHSTLQKYSECFKSNENVSIVKFEDEDVQQLLKESKILVTDFSSVFFDFAYLEKPMVFFQFDEESYYKSHYSKGYFDYRRDGFGTVCVNSDSAVNEIIKIIRSNCEMETEYKNRARSNFIYRDQNNCDRIYNHILALNERKTRKKFM